MKRFLAFALAACAALLPIAAPASAKFVITAASATACTSIAPSSYYGPAQQLLSVINASSSAQTVTLSLYDEGSSPSCASGDLIYSVVLGASQVVNFPVLSNERGGYLSYGLAYKLSAAATANIIVLYY